MPIQTQTIPPAPGGMNTDVNPWAIPEDQCRMAVDFLFDKEAEMNRRGPVKRAENPVSPGNPIGGASPFSKPGYGIVATETPGDLWKVGVLYGDTGSSASLLGVLNAGFTAHTDVNWAATKFDPTLTYAVHSSPHPWGGTFIGTSRGYYGANAFQAIGHWYGSGNARVNGSGGVTATVNQDGTTVTFSSGTPLSGVEPGMFFFGDPNIVTGTTQAFIGIVKTVGATTVTLMQGALFAMTAKTSWSFRPVRPLSQRVAKGLITTTTGSTTVTGTGTKFKRQNLGSPSNSGKWAIFRQDDMAYIGAVDSVASDIQLTLNNNALVKTDKDKYVAIDVLDKDDIPILTSREQGFITANYAGRQWYANRHISSTTQPQSISRVWFSDLWDPEAIDLTADGDHFPIVSTEPPQKPITGMLALSSVLLVFKEDETFGIFGTDPTNFTVKKLVDDGALTGMTVQRFQEGAIWAGKKGIWFFDGQESFNVLEDRMERYYKLAVQEHFNRQYTDTYAMMYRDHYIVNIEGARQPFGPVRAQNDTDGIEPGEGSLTLCINLTTRAISMFTNFAFRGGVTSPADEEVGTLYIVNSMSGGLLTTDDGARICSAEELFDDTGNDEIVTKRLSVGDRYLGPWSFFESRRYDVGDPQQKKLFKQLQMSYKLESEDDVTGYVVTGDTEGADYQTNYMDMSVLLGHNHIATLTNSKWRVTRAKDPDGNWTSGFQNRRIKFLKRSQVIAFRFWENERQNVRTVKIGPMAIGFKMMRPGRP